MRTITTRLPLGFVKRLCWILSLIDYCGFIYPYRSLGSLFKRVGINLWAPHRIHSYVKLPFQVCYADWFDRLVAPIRSYYDEKDLEGWAGRAGLRDVVITATGLHGYRLLGCKVARCCYNPDASQCF